MQKICITTAETANNLMRSSSSGTKNIIAISGKIHIIYCVEKTLFVSMNIMQMNNIDSDKSATVHFATERRIKKKHKTTADTMNAIIT